MNIVKAHLTPVKREARKSTPRSYPVSFVFVVDTNKQPLNPVRPGRARLLLKAGKAAVLSYSPFTLILKTAVEQPQVQPLRLKIDPGSRTTGIAIVDDQSGEVLFAAELTHRGQEIKKALSDPPTQAPSPILASSIARSSNEPTGTGIHRKERRHFLPSPKGRRVSMPPFLWISADRFAYSL